ncbi:type I restriction-modification system subunit M [Lactobacillus bombicola]|uniref:site-specific DNA-methyltransferase (adenine-specific) n=1 Tax=Lactobacillus bombicola TaxID=1505723 RepID=A0A396ST91_9LACO|nr:type I restriction-modification system subunit M [Lactobacillus bombicola]RHW54837.1 type I restriction-modification system subunit M [Lactobacillus bombicola]
MTTITSLEQGLFSAADALRSKMDASQYKNYLLGTVFYKYLSDRMLYYVLELLSDQPDGTLEQAQQIYEENAGDQELINELRLSLGYIIEPKYTYNSILQAVNNHSFQVNQLGDAFNKLESIAPDFDGLFNDYDLYSNSLGSTAQKKTDTIANVLQAIGKIELVKTPGDSLGDAYEYLISQFASESGKKAGEFYTPQQVSELLTRLTLVDKDYSNGMAVYDPAMGSGSLLLNFKKYVSNPERITYYGQEINTSTYNLAKMNMILHNIDPANRRLRNGDTLDEDWPAEEVNNFDAVVMNPPYSQKWAATKGFLDDPRFSSFGVLPPKSKADYAFLLHGYYHLKHSGVMSIVLPHGVLFRGAAEGKIRQKLLESGAIDAVIGLPANLFYSTSIPTVIVVLKKDKSDRNVMFIDASKDFEKVKTQNKLREADIERILATYAKRADVDKYAHLASFDEIKENDFNLNIPRYVDTFEEEPPVDVKQLAAEMQTIKEEEAKVTTKLKQAMAELIGTDPEGQQLLEQLKDIL